MRVSPSDTNRDTVFETNALTELSFGKWLKRQRKAAGLTQENLAQQISCSTITLRKIEAEARRPSEQIVERLAEIFNIPTSERTAFLRFARGRLDSAQPAIALKIPWHPSAPKINTNLPAAFTSLIGREKEIADLCEYLQKPDLRLVTLVGPPGIGKTRLSVEAARASLADFPEGVTFIALAAINNPSLIVSTISQTLEYVGAKDLSTSDTLASHIGEKRMLLVLDNCEHIIDELAQLASELLLACPRLTILATSRESLRIPGEWIYPVPTLNLPPKNALINIEWVAQFPALTLFAERARAVRHDFKLTPENISAVAEICARLDGLPLAIELIAARIRSMSPQVLLERMTGQFILSADGMRALSARQKTLKNAIGWSYNFLSSEEKKTFAALSVFSGGFTLEMAEALLSLCATDKPPSDLVNSLADKSLLQRTFDENGQARDAMLETIQQFAADRLRQSGDDVKVREAHLAYFLALAEQGDKEMRGPRQAEWADRIQNELNNMRVALEWAVANGKTEIALRLIYALGWPWEIRGHYLEAHAWLERIRALPDVKAYPLLLSGVLNHIGRYEFVQRRALQARVLLEESCALASGLGAEGEQRLADALNWLGLLELDFDKEASRKYFTRSRELYAKWGNNLGIALSIFHLGILERQENADASYSYFEQSLAMFRQFEDLFFISRVSNNFGYLYLQQRNFEKAHNLFEQSLSIDTGLQFWYGIADALHALGDLYFQQGNQEAADCYYQESRAMQHEHGLSI